MKLIKLANGDWVDPSTITAIKVHKAGYSHGYTFQDMVAVKHGDLQTVINYESLVDAQKYSDELADQVNNFQQNIEKRRVEKEIQDITKQFLND